MIAQTVLAGGKSKELASDKRLYTRITATIRIWEMQPPGVLEPGSDLLSDMYLLVMNAMLRVEWPPQSDARYPHDVG